MTVTIDGIWKGRVEAVTCSDVSKKRFLKGFSPLANIHVHDGKGYTDLKISFDDIEYIMGEVKLLKRRLRNEK